MGYKILSQGVLDGACLMYAIMNAYKTLVYPDMDIKDYKNESGKQKWENILSIYPRANEMLAFHPFNEYFTDKSLAHADEIISAEFDHIVFTSFIILSDNDRTVSANKLEFDAIGTFDFSNSVIILNIANKIKALAGNEISTHFICINGRTESNFHIACSYSIHQIDPHDYHEQLDAKTNRYYNNQVRVDDVTEHILDMGINEIYRITKS